MTLKPEFFNEKDLARFRADVESFKERAATARTPAERDQFLKMAKGAEEEVKQIEDGLARAAARTRP